MTDIDGFAVGRGRDGVVVLAFFDGTEYVTGANMSLEKADLVARELSRAADRLEDAEVDP